MDSVTKTTYSMTDKVFGGPHSGPSDLKKMGPEGSKSYLPTPADPLRGSSKGTSYGGAPKNFGDHKTKKNVYEDMFNKSYEKGHKALQVGGFDQLRGMGELGPTIDSSVKAIPDSGSTLRTNNMEGLESTTLNFETQRQMYFNYNQHKLKITPHMRETKKIDGKSIVEGYKIAARYGSRDITKPQGLTSLPPEIREEFKRKQGPAGAGQNTSSSRGGTPCETKKAKLPNAEYWIKMGGRSRYGNQEMVADSGNGYSAALMQQPAYTTAYDPAMHNLRGYKPGSGISSGTNAGVNDNGIIVGGIYRGNKMVKSTN